MLTQKKNATNKIHSIHVLPSGKGFSGKLAAGKTIYQFAFTPKSAASVNGNLVLTGSVTVNTPTARRQSADNVTATLLAT
jgi:hypothetical protein